MPHFAITLRRQLLPLAGALLAGGGLFLAFGLGGGSRMPDALIATHRAGYVIVARDGGVFNFGGAAFHGSSANANGSSPIVGAASRASLNGYWTAAADGSVFAFGDAQSYGSASDLHLSHPIVGITATPSGRGYWLVADDGGIFSFGDATFHGSTGNIHLNRPITGITATATGDGYWMVADDGGIFSFGDASFQGSTGDLKLNSPIVGIAATAAVNDPPSIAVTGGLNAFNKPGAVSASGTASDPDGVVRSVQVSVDGGAFSATNVTCSNCGRRNATWTWTSKVALSEGSHQIGFRAVDDGGGASLTSSAVVKVDGTAPTVQITAGPTGGGFIATAKPPFSGSAADSGGSGLKAVSVSIDGGAFSASPVTCTGCAGTSASWSFTPAANLSEGGHTIAFRSTDEAGNGSSNATRTFTVDTVAPGAPVVVAVPTVNIANKTAVTVSGTSEANAAINLAVADAGNAHTVAATGTANGSGNWTITAINLSTFTDGTISATAIATDGAGNVSAASTATTAIKDTVAPATPAIATFPTVNIANKTAVTVSGTSDPNAAINLSVTDAGNAHTVTATGTANGSGNWTITAINLSTLVDGTISATAAATDAAGNASAASTISTATKDTAAPAVAVSSAATANAANKNSVPVSGTVEAGATVSVVASDGTHSTSPVAAGVTGTSWSVNVDVHSLDDATITYTATATDLYANTSADARTAAKDTVVPPAPTVTLPTVNIANKTAVTVSGTSEAGAAISVAVTDAGAVHTVIGTGTANGSGIWAIAGLNLTTLFDGTISAKATATDAAANVSALSTAGTASKDTVAPAAPVVTLPTVNVANKTAVTVSGTSEANATINLAVTDAGSAHTISGSGAANGVGVWSITGIDLSTLADGTISATATATDGAGNTSGNSTLTTATKDTAVPNVTLSSAATANAANQNGVPVSGTVEAGAAVSVVASDGHGHSTAPVNAGVIGTSWSVNIDVQALDDATITYTATATDLNGNTKADAGTAVKDTEGPALSVVAGSDGSADLSLTFDEPVLCSSAGLGAFAATVTGVPANVAVSVGCAGTSSSTLTLGLLLPVFSTDSVQVVILASTITDIYGNTALQLIGNATFS